MRKVRVLLAEDNPGDVILVREAFARHKLPHELQIAADGEEAMDFVMQMEKPGQPPCPDILLLDLNLPKIDGHEVLREFRKHPACATTPVIILSSSDRPADRETVRALGVTRYFKKPTRLDDFLKLGAIVKEAVEETSRPNVTRSCRALASPI
jgi:chemotaxis family two-component system response regulator Rcp1